MAHRSRFLDYSPRMSMQSTEIKLKLWVFKIVFGQFEVCVEGYRPKDRDETELKCWHSTAIADRLTSSMLQTKSGSTYTLHGPMDTDAAQIYGYPDYLIEAFKDGFPPNWRELLTDFHTMLVRSSQCDISQWFNSSLMAERRRSSMNVSRRQSAIFPSLTEAVNKYSRDKQLVPVGRRSFRSRQSFVIPASAPMTPVAEDRSAERDPEELVVNHTDGSPLAAVPRTSPLTAVRKSPRLSSVPPAEQIIEVAQNDEEQIAEVASPSPSPTKIGPAMFESTKVDSPPANDENRPPPMETGENIFKIPTMPAPKPRKGKNAASELSAKGSDRDLIVEDLNIVASVVLQNWVFKLVNGDFAVCLEGYRTDAPDKCWHSTAIVERVTARLLKTGSGTVYGLEGPIDTAAAANPYGYPKYLVSLFEHGFPPDWKEILHEFYESRIQTNQTNVSQWFAADEPVEQSMMEATLPLAAAVDRVSRQKQLDVVSTNHAEGTQQSSSATNPLNNQDDVVFAKPSMPAPKRVKKPGQKKWDSQSLHSDFGDISARLSASADGDGLFRASRSGRVIKPPLASWAGQRITYDQDGKAKHIVDSITEVATQQRGFSLAALSQVYGVSPVRQPTQQERRISLLQPAKKKKRRSGGRSVSRTADGISSESSDSSLSPSSDESDSPIGKRRNKTTSRFRFDDSAEYEIAREERRQRRKEKRRRRKQRELEKLQQKKAKRARSTTSRSTKRRSPQTKKPSRAKSTTSKISRSTKGGGRAAKSTASRGRRSPSLSSSASSHSASPPPPTKKAKKPAAKRWTNEEYKRLQIALRAVLPRDEDGWNKVANSLGGDRTAAQCQNAANRVLGYDLQMEEEDLPQSAAPQVTAKVGTAAYQVQANRYLRSYLHTTGNDDDDYFENTCDMAASTLAFPSLGDLNPNDSLLSVMFTPTNVPRGKNRVFVPRPVSTPGSAVMSPSYDQSPASILDSASRDRKARYAHQLLQERVERLAMMGRQKPTRDSLSAANNRKAKKQQDELLSRYLNDVRRKQHEDEDEESENDDQYFSESNSD